MDGKRDGFASVQLDGNQLVAQTRSGMITLLDVENGGRALWRSRPGRAYQATLPPAFNSRGVFANDSGAIYGVDRATRALLWKYRAARRPQRAPVGGRTAHLHRKRGGAPHRSAPARNEQAHSGGPESDPFSGGRG